MDFFIINLNHLGQNIKKVKSVNLICMSKPKLDLKCCQAVHMIPNPSFSFHLRSNEGQGKDIWKYLISTSSLHRPLFGKSFPGDVMENVAFHGGFQFGSILHIPTPDFSFVQRPTTLKRMSQRNEFSVSL